MKDTCLFLLMFSLAACTLNERDLQGRWQAAAFFENGQTVPVPTDEIRLDLAENSRYRFLSTSRYSEAGRYRCSMRYLFLTDTTAAQLREKTLKVVFLSEDSLKIRMEKDGKTQILFFGKISEAKQD